MSINSAVMLTGVHIMAELNNGGCAAGYQVHLYTCVHAHTYTHTHTWVIHLVVYLKTGFTLADYTLNISVKRKG